MSGVDVTFTLDGNNVRKRTFSGTTDSNGQVSGSIADAPDDTYTARATETAGDSSHPTSLDRDNPATFVLRD